MITRLLCLYAIALLAFVYTTQLRARRSGASSWDELAATLYAVRMKEIVSISHTTTPNVRSDKYLPQTLLRKMGGREAIRRLQHNTAVMVKLAYAINTRSQGLCSSEVNELQRGHLLLTGSGLILRVLLLLPRCSALELVVIRHVAATYKRIVELLIDLHERHAPQRTARLLASCNWDCASGSFRGHT